jgi:hypothetical protein
MIGTHSMTLNDDCIEKIMFTGSLIQLIGWIKFINLFSYFLYNRLLKSVKTLLIFMKKEKSSEKEKI